jgi:hypothetical protein
MASLSPSGPIRSLPQVLSLGHSHIAAHDHIPEPRIPLPVVCEIDPFGLSDALQIGLQIREKSRIHQFRILHEVLVQHAVNQLAFFDTVQVHRLFPGVQVLE